MQWRRQDFTAAGAQPGHQNLDWGTLKMRSFLLSSRSLLQAPTLFRTNGSTHGRKNSFLWEKLMVVDSL